MQKAATLLHLKQWLVQRLDDLSNVLLVVAPIAGTACVIYFAVRHGAADEMDQKKWKQRIVVAVVSIVVAVVASALIKVLVSYYQ